MTHEARCAIAEFTCRGVARPGEVGGLNWLGHLLMARRAELRAGL